MNIVVKTKSVYGNALIYPVCPKAKLFARIAGSKTLTSYTIRKIYELGYEIAVETQTL
mgnify:CR=1 FL=1